MSAEKFYTARAAWKDFFKKQIGEAYIRRKIKSGEIGSIAVGVRRLVPESELVAFIERHKRQASEE